MCLVRNKFVDIETLAGITFCGARFSVDIVSETYEQQINTIIINAGLSCCVVGQ